jgi:hypothetical protein
MDEPIIKEGRGGGHFILSPEQHSLLIFRGQSHSSGNSSFAKW